MHQPLIRFRYAIRKAAEVAGHAVSTPPPKAAAAAPVMNSAKSSNASTTIPPRMSVRMEKPIPRAKLTDSEMDAIMLGGA